MPLPAENPNPMRLPEEYELVYNDELSQVPEQNDRPIHLRSKYPSGNNRDVRSGILESSTSSSTTTSLPPAAQSPLSLWDLELDNEAVEQAVDAAAAAVTKSSSSSSQTGYRRRKRQRRNEAAAVAASSSDATTNNAGEDATTSPEDAPPADWYLASISSTGVLLKALGNATSSVDFVFVLNIRESEAFPPLFSPQDLNCVEEKISAYKSELRFVLNKDELLICTYYAGYTADNLRVLRKQFLKQCLSERLVDVDPALPKYESQLIITRIGITCTCRSLQPGEVCSELDHIDAQRWTEFMGNEGNGFYAN